MKKSLIRLLSVLMVACMLASMLTPFSVFAADNESGTVPKATTPTYVFRETFSSGSINTSGSGANIEAAKGFGLLDSGNCTYTLENDTLKLNSTSGNGAYIDIRFNATTTTKDLTQDFTLSFWIKPDTDNITIKKTGWAWYDTNDGGSAAAEKNIFYIKDGNIVLNEVSYPNAHLNKDEWSLIEIVFNYDENATSNSGKQGATVSYTVIFNGDEVATAAAPIKHNNINYFRIFRYPNATYELDDLTVSLGNKSLFDIPRTGPAEFIYREEFDKGYINTRNVVSSIAGAYGFWGNHSATTTYNLDGGALNYTTRASSDYIDLRFYIDDNTKDMARDLTFSFWIKPTTSNLSTGLSFGESGSTSDDSIVKIAKGKLVIGGTTHNDAVVPADQWSHIEVMCDYDKTAIATNNKTGAFTSFTVRLNGKDVATIPATTGKLVHTFNTNRLFRYSNAPFSIDDLSITVGLRSTYALGRSAAPTPVKGEVVFTEDFSDAINTSNAESDVVAANGFYASVTNGTTFNIENGSLNYIVNRYKDNIRLEFWHDDAKIELSQDFVLSYKIKSVANTTYRMYWKDHACAKDEYSFRHWVNRIRICDEGKEGGVDNPDVFTKPGEWALMELFFHYDENATAETGEKGAFTFYSIYVNGEYVQTTKTFYNFHKIDDFTLFMLSEDDFSIDDLTIAYGNVSLGGEEFDDGWDKMDYYLDAEVTEDYDYSICIVGDTQILTAYREAAYSKLFNWIADNAEAKKMVAVLGLGDVTSTNSDAQWQTAVQYISLLNGVVPYTVINGNHDKGAAGSEDNMINTYFNNETYKAQFGGFYDDNNVNTFWMPITAGNDKYIVIGLDFGPTDAELEWAANVIEANPDAKIIITTHSYMDGNGNVMDDNNFGTSTEEGTNSGAEIWEKLGRKYANIQMILCGHMEGDYIAVRQDKGDNGNVVTQMMINPQWIDDALTAGSGNVTMFYFNEGSDTIIVETYSTVAEQHFMAENQFTLDLNPESEGGDEGGSEGGDDELPDIIYSNDFSDESSMNTTNNATNINAANGMWNKFTLGTEYSLDKDVFNFISKVQSDPLFELRYYYEGNYKDLKQDFILSFWLKPTSANAQFRVDMGKSDTMDTKVFAVVANKLRINNVIYDDAALALNEWSLIEIVAHYDATKGGTYAYTVMLNGEVVDTVNALIVQEEIDRFIFFKSRGGTFSIDNLIIATGNQSLIDTLNTAPTIDCEHTYDNACDTLCNVCAMPRTITHDYTVTDKNDTQHWKKCSVCGTVDESTKADHEFDNACDTDCACGFTRTITHDYTVTDKNDAQHWKKCSVCGTVDESTKADHEFDNACDTDCACGFTRTITHDYTVTDKNDTQHWKKCSVCGTVDESTKADHEFDNACDTDCACGYTRTITHDYTVTDKNDTQHWKKCSVCGTVDESTKADHSYDDVYDTDCDCGYDRGHQHVYDTLNFDGENHWYECSCGLADEMTSEEHYYDSDCDAYCDCGYERTAPHNFGTELTYDDEYHWIFCIDCGDADSDTVSAHVYDDDCDTDCECGYERIAPHNYKSEYEADGEFHWIICADCEDEMPGSFGEHIFENSCDTDCECGYVREITHTYAGDCDAVCDVCSAPRTQVSDHVYENNCDGVCNVCGETRTTVHTYTNVCDATCDVCFENRTPALHTGGTATCTAKAVCSVCGAEYGEYAAHVYGSEWVSGSVRHWHECTCGSKSDEADHVFGDWTEKDGTRIKSCECGYTVNDAGYKAEETMSTGATVALYAVPAFAVIAIGFGTYWFVFRKKK